WDPAVRALRIRSTFGQHILLGSYLVAIIPLTMARLVWAWRDPEPPGTNANTGRGSAGERLGSFVLGAVWVAGAVGLVVLAARWDLACALLVLWGVAGAVVTVALAHGRGFSLFAWAPTVAVLLASQVLVVMLSKARGAFFGMVAGMAVTAFFLLVRR